MKLDNTKINHIKDQAEIVFKKYTKDFYQDKDEYFYRIKIFDSLVPKRNVLSIYIDVYIDRIVLSLIPLLNDYNEENYTVFLKDLETFAKQMYFMEIIKIEMEDIGWYDDEKFYDSTNELILPIENTNKILDELNILTNNMFI